MTLNDEEFKLFQGLLVEKSGLYFPPDRKEALESALQKRLKESKQADYADYYAQLSSGDGRHEFLELVDLLTIGETYFFRNHFQFEVLQENVLPKLLEKKKSLKIWSAGCATGEEAYTLAMILLESMPDIENWDVSILATDINQHYLDQAKQGVYSQRAVSKVPQNYLSKYFKKTGNKYYLSDAIKNRVVFMRHNLVEDPFTLDGMQGADVVFCRNVIIYFDLPTIKKTIDRFYHALSDDGYLFLGFSESLWQIDDRFGVVEFPHTFIYKKGFVPAPAPSHLYVDIPEIIFESTPSPMPIPPLPPAKREEIAPYIKKALELANAADYEGALQELKHIALIDNLCEQCYYLMGVLLERTGQLDEAIREYRRAIYVNQNLSIAYFNLGNIYAFQKNKKQALKEYNNAIKILQSQPPDAPVPFSDSLYNNLLLTACRKRMEVLDTILLDGSH